LATLNSVQWVRLRYLMCQKCKFAPAPRQSNKMQFVVRLAITLAVIILCTQIGRKLPSLAGLIATMPLTGLIVLVWLYSENPHDLQLMTNYTKGALWGIGPSILFFLAAYVCFKKHLSLPAVLSISFGLWLIGAFVHQWLLHK